MQLGDGSLPKNNYRTFVVVRSKLSNSEGARRMGRVAWPHEADDKLDLCKQAG